MMGKQARAPRPSGYDPADDTIRQSVAIGGVSHFYRTSEGFTQALNDCSFEAHGGEFVSLLGPSGCGKSTLLTIIAGLVKPTVGTVMVNGADVRGPVHDVGIVFQDPALLEWRSSLSNVLLQVELRKGRRSDYVDRAKHLLDKVGLEGFHGKRPHELSGGMRQRVAICRALIHAPALMLMDEPFGALDALTRDEMSLELQDVFLGGDRLIVFVTHSIQEAVFLSDRVLVMSPRPGTIRMDLAIELPRPRRLEERTTTRFLEYVAEITEEFRSMGVFNRGVDRSGDRS